MASFDPRKKKILASYAQSSRYMGMGMHFAVSTLLGTGVGWYLDKSWSTLPLFLLLGMFLGASVGFYHLYKTLMGIEKEEKEEKEGH
jgi:F0F1-type ATP synthase assembly protein I